MSHRWKRNQVGWIVNRKKKNSSKGANVFEPFWTFPHCLFPSPSIHPLLSLPVLYSTSGAIFPPLPALFLPLSVPLSAYVWWYQCSRTPPLTDNSLDGTLLCTVQCTAILPQWALDLWWMDRTTPSAVSGTCQTEGGGSHGWRVSYEGGLYHVCAWEIGAIWNLSGFNLWHGTGWCVWFWFCVLKDYMYLRMWSPEAWIMMYLCAFCDAHPLLCCYGDCCSLV